MTATVPASDCVDILLVEDNPGDVRLAREAFDEVDANISLTVVGDGNDALSLLRQEGEFAEADPPSLILLDLDLPGKHGAEVLSEVKSDERLRHIPVIVLTTTDDQSAIVDLYGNHANAFVTKPDDVTQFIDMVSSVKSFWLSNATLPERRGYE